MRGGVFGNGMLRARNVVCPENSAVCRTEPCDFEGERGSARRDVKGDFLARGIADLPGVALDEERLYILSLRNRAE